MALERGLSACTKLPSKVRRRLVLGAMPLLIDDVPFSGSWFLFWCTLASCLCIQIATNLFNDAVDHRKGADTANRLGPRRVTASGMLSPRVVMTGALAFCLAATLIAIPLIREHGWVIVLIGAVSLFFAYGYTGGPFPLAYRGMGELFVILFFGFVAVSGSYYVQGGEWGGLEIWTLGLQCGLYSSVLIAINNLRDIVEDKASGKRTLAVRFGKTFARAETFLWAVRCHMHYATKRATDQLTFDLQVEVAERMGYADAGGRRAVEHFMQDYFRHATRVGELTRIFLTELEARHAKPEASIKGLFRRKKRVRPGLKLVQGRIDVDSPSDFVADKLNLLRIFEEALRTGYLLHPDAMRLIAANLNRIDDEMRSDPEAVHIFLDLLLKHGNPERALRRMNELGVLGAFIPEFEPIVAMMQFNVYHHYTVDEHTIQCISTLAQIERGELIEELPVASRILTDGVNRRILYMALFLHDMGKGRPEDHAILGAQIARRVAPRLGLSAEESETVEWLVRYHLLMSDIAQKRDLSDPRTVRDFAKAVKTRERLDLLTVLTVCDIRGVGPGTWNNWKAMLLRQLYRDTAAALEGGLESLNRAQREDEAKRALRDVLSDWEQKDLRAETARHYAPYWQGLTTETQAVFARLLRGLRDDEIRIDLHPEVARDATRACFALADHPGIFSRLAGALALVGANVVDARTYTSKDGYATAVFWIQDVEGKPYEVAKLPRLRGMIDKTLNGEIKARDALKDRDKVRKRESQFRFPTHIVFDNEGSEIYTIIEVDTRDRPGLLFDLTRTLAVNNIYIASAVIATYGAQVVDTFYVKDMFGLKLHTKSRQEALERKLRQAITEGVERALS